MAADTAYLEGGPCAGTTQKITPAAQDTGELVCKGGLYRNPQQGATHNGDIIFKDAGAPSPSGWTGTGAKAAHAHHGWSDLQHSVNEEWPRALRSSERLTREALRSLQRAHRVKR